jgi:hypothetical protein
MANTKPPFQAFTITFEIIVDRIITPVKLAKAFNPQIESPDNFQHIEFNALWDTGATKSVITSSTAKQLGIIPSGLTKVNHAGGSSESNTYLINILLPNGVGIAGVQVSECPNSVGNFGVLIGMDIINRGDLSISNLNNRTCMSFRLPSYKTYDFVKEFNKILFQGTKPYAPCPCGKVDNLGKPIKFSQCHGKKK